MKIYVAAPSMMVDRVKELYDRIDALGHSVSFRWAELESVRPYNEHQEKSAEFSSLCIDAAMNSDMVLVLCRYDQSARGTYMEFGAALAQRHLSDSPRIFVVDESNHPSMFFYHEAVERVSLDEFFALLE